MTHRGATGADSRDGDGAGVMVGLPHKFFVREGEREIGVKLPKEGEYAVGNVFFRKPERPDWRHDPQLKAQQKTFAEMADKLDLRVLGWRHVPTDNTILGPAALSREPIILQPFVVLKTAYGADTKESQNGEFDEKYFERQLYVLRKHSTHTIKLETGFYICSLSTFFFQTIPVASLTSFPSIRQQNRRLQRTALASSSLLLLPRSVCTPLLAVLRAELTILRSIGTTFSSPLTSVSSTLDSRPTLSLLGIEHSLCDGQRTTERSTRFGETRTG